MSLRWIQESIYIHSTKKITNVIESCIHIRSTSLKTFTDENDGLFLNVYVQEILQSLVIFCNLLERKHYVVWSRSLEVKNKWLERIENRKTFLWGIIKAVEPDFENSVGLFTLSISNLQISINKMTRARITFCWEWYISMLEAISIGKLSGHAKTSRQTLQYKWEPVVSDTLIGTIR